MDDETPASGEVALLGAKARGLSRAALKLYPNLSLPAAIAQMHEADKTPTGYSKRNELAIDSMVKFSFEPRTEERIAELQRTTDPVKHAALKHELDVWRLEFVDWDAYSRFIEANGRRIDLEVKGARRES